MLGVVKRPCRLLHESDVAARWRRRAKRWHRAGEQQRPARLLVRAVSAFPRVAALFRATASLVHRPDVCRRARLQHSVRRPTAGRLDVRNALGRSFYALVAAPRSFAHDLSGRRERRSRPADTDPRRCRSDSTTDRRDASGARAAGARVGGERKRAARLRSLRGLAVAPPACVLARTRRAAADDAPHLPRRVVDYGLVREADATLRGRSAPARRRPYPPNSHPVRPLAAAIGGRVADWATRWTPVESSGGCGRATPACWNSRHRPRPPVSSYSGAVEPFVFRPSLRAAEVVEPSLGVTLFMTLLAGCKACWPATRGAVRHRRRLPRRPPTAWSRGLVACSCTRSPAGRTCRGNPCVGGTLRRVRETSSGPSASGRFRCEKVGWKSCSARSLSATALLPGCWPSRMSRETFASRP